MVSRTTLFDDQHMDQPEDLKKEVTRLEKLKSLEDKIATAIERVKTLKDEKAEGERKIRELERMLDEKSEEVEQLRSDRNVVKGQLEALLNEIEAIEAE
jgi:chromosome segregation ATPase